MLCVQNLRPVVCLAQTEERLGRKTRFLFEQCIKQDEDVRYLTAKVAALEKQDGNAKELIAALENQVEAQTKTINALKAADTTSTKINALDTKTEQSLQASLKDAQSQIAKWQGRASFWKHVSLIGAPLLIVIAVAATLVVGK